MGTPVQTSQGASKPFVGEDAPKGTMFSIVRPQVRWVAPLHRLSSTRVRLRLRAVHPADLKKAVAEAITTLLEPVQSLFETDASLRRPKRTPTGRHAVAKKRKEKKINPRFAHLYTKEEGGHGGERGGGVEESEARGGEEGRDEGREEAGQVASGQGGGEEGAEE